MAFRSVLIVDDEESMRHLLSVILRDHGYEARADSNGEDALKELAARDYDLVLSDVRMPRMDGLKLLREVQRIRPDLTFIVMSAYGTHDTAIEAMKAGAYDYVSKPFKPDEVVLVLKKAEERERLARENRRLRTEQAEGYRIENLIGSSEAMLEVLRQFRKVAPLKTTVSSWAASPGFVAEGEQAGVVPQRGPRVHPGADRPHPHCASAGAPVSDRGNAPTGHLAPGPLGHRLRRRQPGGCHRPRSRDREPRRPVRPPSPRAATWRRAQRAASPAGRAAVGAGASPAAHPGAPCVP